MERPEALTANAYLGAFGIAECLRAGADVVVTGRVTDASLVVGAAIAYFGWGRDDLDALAGATVAGHILECGAQATGGNFSFFTELPDGARRPGFPIAEIAADGSAVITKHPGTGGAVTVETVTAQLLYEIGAPGYLGPDVVTHLDTLTLSQQAPDRVAVTGARGTPPPPTLKVGVNRLGGFRNAMTFVLCGLDIEAKAALVRAQLTDAVGAAGLEFDLARTDRPDAASTEQASALLTVHLRDSDAARVGRAFSAAAVELALASYPGCTLTTLPGDATPFGVFSAAFVGQEAVRHVAVLPDGSRVDIPPPAVTAAPVGAAPPAEPRGAEGAPAPPEPGAAAVADPVPAAAPGVAATRVGDLVPTGPPGAVAGRAGGALPATASGAGPAAHRGPTRRGPLGLVVGARSGDKGGDANLGVWARSAAGYDWLASFLTVARLRELLPETASLEIERWPLANLRAVNFVIHGLLGRGWPPPPGSTRRPRRSASGCARGSSTSPGSCCRDRAGYRRRPARTVLCGQPGGDAGPPRRAGRRAGAGPGGRRGEVRAPPPRAGQAAPPRAHRAAAGPGRAVPGAVPRSPRSAPTTRSAPAWSAGIGVVEGVECLIIANDPTVRGGAVNPYVAAQDPAGWRDRGGEPAADGQPGRVGRRRPAHPGGDLHSGRARCSAT